MKRIIARWLNSYETRTSDDLPRRRVTIFSAPMIPVFALVLAVACADSFTCPAERDDLTTMSFGRFTLGNAGDDDTARRCVSKCGWHVFQGNNGGIGNTLQVASPSEDIVFAWADNSFAGFRVKTGWSGATDRGVRLGDTIADFERKYPEFTKVNNRHLTGDPEGVHADAYFDVNGLLTELLVGGYITP
jgi:hypothetical protein